MGKEKGGFLTPKAISNRIKAKGLQKLRWYCQMCQKQCRDENGFKCHTMSESHQRQLLLFADNPDKFLNQFSKEFLDDFLELLKRRFGTKRVSANVVYQEYIAFKEHVHMNATEWETLTNFVKWLGREGYCVVDETEKGWFIAYIDRDWEAIKKQEDSKKKEKMILDDEERIQKFVDKQIERAGGVSTGESSKATELKRNEEEKVILKIGGEKTTQRLLPSATKAFDKDLDGPSTSASLFKAPKDKAQKRKTALDEIMEMEEQTKEKIKRKDYWLAEGIVVKIITKKLGEKYCKKKAVVKEVVNNYGGIVKVLDTGDRVKVDQSHLETVIPALGKLVRVVNGAYRGSDAELLALNEQEFSCTIRIANGLLKGRMVEKVQYEDISKVYQST